MFKISIVPIYFFRDDELDDDILVANDIAGEELVVVDGVVFPISELAP